MREIPYFRLRSGYIILVVYGLLTTMGLQIKSMPSYLQDDQTVAEIVIRYAQKSECTSGLEKLSGQDLLNTLGNWGVADWKEYEYWAKKLFLSLVKEHKLEVTRLYLVSKFNRVIKDTIFPRATISVKGTPQTLPFQNVLPWNPLHVIYLIPFLLILLVVGHSLHQYQWKLFIISFLVSGCGMIPSVAFYSDTLTRGGLSVMMVVTLYCSITISATYLYRRVKNFYQTKLQEPAK